MNKKTLKFIGLVIIFILAGTLTALCSLLLSILVETIVFGNLKESVYLFLNVFLEEIAKLVFLYFLFDLFLKKSALLSKMIFLSIFLGLGFGLSEVLFILFQNPSINLILPSIVLLLVHVFTSILLSLTIWNFKKARTVNLFFASFWLITAILVHFFYNLFAINYN